MGGIIVHPENVTPDIHQFALNSREKYRFKRIKMIF
jgi:hypothetical protein